MISNIWKQISENDEEKKKPSPSGLDTIDKPHESIIRYMSFGKFIDLLSKKSFFFSQLSQMTDKNEGILHSDRNIQFTKLLMKKYLNHSDDVINEAEKILTNEQKLYEEKKEFYFINSWTINETESFSHWKIYIPGGEGIAIKTTKKKLTEAIDDSYKDSIKQGPIKYLPFASANRDEVFFIKRRPYIFENEYRLGFDLTALNESSLKTQLISECAQTNGIRVPIKDLGFIESVYVSPFGGKYQHALINEIKDRYACDFNLSISEINES